MATKPAPPRPESKSSAASRARPKRGSRSQRRTRRDAARAPDAIRLLKADHREVKAWFAEFEKTEDDKAKRDLAERICAALLVHTRIEEELFYPAAYDALDEDGDDLLDEAQVEHASAKALIAEIQAMAPGEPLYDAKVKLLGEYIDHHAREEETELFPECRDAGMDLKALGEAMAARKAELMAETGR
jgi:hemerythrin superfamily protein